MAKVRPIDLAGFEAKFTASDDPWSTWDNPDEVLKRRSILQALGPGPLGRVLELGAGNGSNSHALAGRTLRLDATEATARGTQLVARAIDHHRNRARALQLTVPDPLPRDRYDAVVIAELLYYLDPRAMRDVARQVAAVLRPGGRLVLAHHRITVLRFRPARRGSPRALHRSDGALIGPPYSAANRAMGGSRLRLMIEARSAAHPTSVQLASFRRVAHPHQSGKAGG